MIYVSACDFSLIVQVFVWSFFRENKEVAIFAPFGAIDYIRNHADRSGIIFIPLSSVLVLERPQVSPSKTKHKALCFSFVRRSSKCQCMEGLLGMAPGCCHLTKVRIRRTLGLSSGTLVCHHPGSHTSLILTPTPSQASQATDLRQQAPIRRQVCSRYTTPSSIVFTLTSCHQGVPMSAEVPAARGPKKSSAFGLSLSKPSGQPEVNQPMAPAPADSDVRPLPVHNTVALHGYGSAD